MSEASDDRSNTYANTFVLEHDPYLKQQSVFFININDAPDLFCLDFENKIIISGDFNVTFDPNLDCSGGTPVKKDSVKCIQDMYLDYDLIDIWRVRNPDIKRFTWRQRKPFIQRRLDFWLISDACQDDVEDTYIIPSINSDHSAIVLHFSTMEKQNHGPSYWKFNSSLTNDTNYVTLINQGNVKTIAVPIPLPKISRK